jgi:hypothetical protein
MKDKDDNLNHDDVFVKYVVFDFSWNFDIDDGETTGHDYCSDLNEGEKMIKIPTSSRSCKTTMAYVRNVFEYDDSDEDY